MAFVCPRNRRLTRTSAIVGSGATATGNSTILSPDGSSAYVAYLGVPQTGPLAAEVFLNASGTLVSRASVPVDPAFPNVDSADASPDFTSLYLVDDDGASTLRIRRFDANLTLLNTRLLTDFDFVDSYPLIAVSRDGQFLSITYAPTTDTTTTRLTVLDAISLATLDTAEGVVGFFVQTGQWFSLRSRCGRRAQNYFAFAGGPYPIDAPAPQAPQTLAVYAFDRDAGLTLQATAPLPAFTYALATSWGACDEALIALGLPYLVPSPAEPLITPTVPARSVTLLPGDLDNLRIYSFSALAGLRLAYRESLDAFVGPLAFTHDNRHLFVGLQGEGLVGNDATVLGTLRIIRRCPDRRRSGRCGCDSDIPLRIDASESRDSVVTLPVGSQAAAFSADDGWFIALGVSVDTLVGPSRNIALYRVTPLDDPCRCASDGRP